MTRRATPEAPRSRGSTRTDLVVASSGRGSGRNRPRGGAGPARGRPGSSRSPGRSTGRPTSRSTTSRGAAGRPGMPRSSGSGAAGGKRPPSRAGGGRARRSPRRDQPTQPRPRFTGRMAIVVVVLAVLFVSYATSLRAFLAQRSDISALEAQIARDQHTIEELREEQRRWKDAAYVAAQARERFGWVLPGEIGFRVIGEDGRPLDTSSQLTDPASLGQDPDSQWWSTTWASIRGAGEREDAGPGPAVRLGPREKAGPGRRGRHGSGAGGSARGR
jgi:cell division protein FtsB